MRYIPYYIGISRLAPLALWVTPSLPLRRNLSNIYIIYPERENKTKPPRDAFIKHLLGTQEGLGPLREKRKKTLEGEDLNL